MSGRVEGWAGVVSSRHGTRSLESKFLGVVHLCKRVEGRDKSCSIYTEAFISGLGDVLLLLLVVQIKVEKPALV